MKVTAESVYLTDDTNRAIFPNDRGEFSSFQLQNLGHYEVHGHGTAITPTLDDQSNNSSGLHLQPFTSPTFSFVQRLSTFTPLNASSTSARRLHKTFQRWTDGGGLGRPTAGVITHTNTSEMTEIMYIWKNLALALICLFCRVTVFAFTEVNFWLDNCWQIHA